MCRIFRIFKVVRHFETSSILSQAARESWKPLLVPLLFLLIFVMLFGAIIFFVEPCYDPDACVFTDIFNAAYFVTVTMTTVGYGDQIPVSEIGRFVAMAAMLFGSFFMAMPLAIIGNNFEKAWQELAPEMGEKDEEDEHEKAMRSIRPVDPDTFREHTWEYRRIRASILYFSLTRRLSKLHAIATRTFDQMKQKAQGASPVEGEDSPPPANDPRIVLHKDIINVRKLNYIYIYR